MTMQLAVWEPDSGLMRLFTTSLWSPSLAEKSRLLPHGAIAKTPYDVSSFGENALLWWPCAITLLIAKGMRFDDLERKMLQEVHIAWLSHFGKETERRAFLEQPQEQFFLSYELARGIKHRIITRWVSLLKKSGFFKAATNRIRLAPQFALLDICKDEDLLREYVHIEFECMVACGWMLPCYVAHRLAVALLAQYTDTFIRETQLYRDIWEQFGICNVPPHMDGHRITGHVYTWFTLDPTVAYTHNQLQNLVPALLPCCRFIDGPVWSGKSATLLGLVRPGTSIQFVSGSTDAMRQKTSLRSRMYSAVYVDDCHTLAADTLLAYLRYAVHHPGQEHCFAGDSTRGCADGA
jgi:hypothetical protein